MSIGGADLKWFKSKVISDVANNGGGMSAVEVISGVKNNLFPNVTHLHRVSGITRYRKAFMHNQNSEELTLESSLCWVGRMTPAGDYIRIKAGTNIDIQSDATDYTNWKGAGTLNTNITGGVTTQCDVVFDTADGVYDGNTVHISDGINEEFFTIDSSSGVSWAGSTATLILAGGATFTYSYSSGPSTIVAACESLGDIVASSSDWQETNIHGGSYDEGTYPLVVYNAGTVEDEWTLTFTGSGAFGVSGTITGSVGSGTTSADFKPANGSSYYFMVDKDGWSGSWDVGDSITFDTHHAAKAVWVKEVVPAGAASYSNNNPRLDLYGESSG